ncbi:hypothetical protein PR048_022620 [Dryococelus australis]|uniref:PiggyBac transposable element-derived protein domain-containing protein n=1 Tax=Dryococelus australis TaxID=614101 RepID=A0ABQ9H1U5_9NEOP|nr:hypothetical protein PR048_022620 [Dryococelus australis]
MIPYFCRHGCKQFLRLKPVRFGFKAWVMAQSCGYCLAADLYQGMVQGLVTKVFPRDSDTKIICSLSEDMKGTGTDRINRLWKCPISDKKVMQKRERGSYELYTEENKGISAVAWRDNNVPYQFSMLTLVQLQGKAHRQMSFTIITSSWEGSICSTITFPITALAYVGCVYD